MIFIEKFTPMICRVSSAHPSLKFSPVYVPKMIADLMVACQTVEEFQRIWNDQFKLTVKAKGKIKVAFYGTQDEFPAFGGVLFLEITEQDNENLFKAGDYWFARYPDGWWAKKGDATCLVTIETKNGHPVIF